MGWVLAILLLATVASVPATLAAVAWRPSRTTVRAATAALLVLPAVVILLIAIAAMF